MDFKIRGMEKIPFFRDEYPDRILQKLKIRKQILRTGGRGWQKSPKIGVRTLRTVPESISSRS